MKANNGKNPTCTLQEFTQRYKKARGMADQWSSLLESCYANAIPFRNKFYRPKEQQGEMKNSRIYDTTPVEATKTFVSRMHDAMTPPKVQWGYLMLDDEWENVDPKEKNDAQDMLDAYMRRLFKYIHHSNFDVVINECYFDVAVGTSCLIVNQNTDDQPFLFTSVPADKLCIDECLDGSIKTWFRTWDDVKVDEIKTRWKKAELPSELATMAQYDKEAKISKVYEGVVYKPGYKKPYVYAAWCEQGFFFQDYYEQNPAVIWRFQKTNNDVWGRGPIMDALPSMISLQEIAKIEMASANLNVFRPYMAFSDGVFNPHTFKLQPMSVIPIAPTGASGSFPIQPLPDGSNPQFAQVTINDLRMQIRTLLFSELPDDNESIQPKSASEVMANQQKLAKKIGPLFARLQHEFLEPVIMRCASILNEMGILPMPKIDGKLVRFQYRSPLELAQGQESNQAFLQFMQLWQGIVGAEMAQLYVDPMKAPYLLARNMQVDLRMLQDESNMEIMLEQIKQNAPNTMGEESPQDEGQQNQLPSEEIA